MPPHEIDIHSQASLKLLQTKYQFLNSVDRDFTTPLILALKNKRMAIVKDLLEQPRTCLRQASMKYGTALHVALSHDDFKVGYKILRMLKGVKDFQAS